MLPENTTGSYLVCEDAQKPRCFTLFLRNKENVTPHPIQIDKAGKVSITKEKFCSIHDLVNYYCAKFRPCVVPEHHNEIDRKELKMVKKLSSDGKFSEVWEALLKANLVVVKKTSTMGRENPYYNCLYEAHIMQNLVHGNIVRLLGICKEEIPHCIIMEHMVRGNLHDFLNTGAGKKLQEPDLIKMAAQVASGMLQLELLNCIHRDLAAKNVFVGENLICKVGNFHYAQIDEGANFPIKCNVRWTAPEALESTANFSIKSDVWSFGVVLFEIITHGLTPYQHMTEDKVKHKVVHDKYRLPQPHGCPDKLYTIMTQYCWNEDPACRYTFESLQWQLDDFDIAKEEYLYSYVQVN